MSPFVCAPAADANSTVSAAANAPALLLAIIVILLGSWSLGCERAEDAAPPGATLVQAERLSMGSPVHVSAWTAERDRANAAFDAAFAEFDRLDSAMSVWRPGSDVLRINAAAGQHPVAVGADVLETLRIARQVSDWTGGKFDVTFGALSGLWKFDHDQDNRIPDMQEVRRRLPLIDYTQIDIDEQAHTVFLRQTGASIHLGGIGKGYALDRAAAVLRAAGFRDFLIQAGGDLYVAGHRDAKPWRLGIQDPRGPANQSFAAIDLSDATFSTSGDYERFFLRDGRRYHHILDPDAGQPVTLSRSVTIVTDRAVMADALSTGVFVLGPEKGMALIERLPGVEGVIVGARNEVLVSSGLKGRLALLAPPTDAP
jgi:FAD:protein FMN transferase